MRWGPTLADYLPKDAAYHVISAAAREKLRKQEEDQRKAEAESQEEDPIVWTQGEEEVWEDVGSEHGSAQSLGSDDVETEEMLAKRQELNYEAWHLDGLCPVLEDRAKNSEADAKRLEDTLGRRTQIKAEKQQHMTVRMRVQAAQASLDAKEGQLKQAEESLRMSEEAARQAQVVRDRVMCEHREAQDRLAAANKEAAAVKEARKERKRQEKAAKAAPQPQAAETPASPSKRRREEAGAAEEEGEANAEQARLREMVRALEARLTGIIGLAKEAGDQSGLEKLREAALGTEGHVEATPPAGGGAWTRRRPPEPGSPTPPRARWREPW